MRGITRRGAINASLAAIVAGSAARSWLVGSPAFAAPAVALPSGPRRLSRTLKLGLFDGGAITVTRRWRVSFTPQGSGIAINGTQVYADVDAPRTLERLAEIERNRDTDAMFPILLSQTGQLVATGDARDIDTFSSALRAADAFLAKSKMPGSEALRHRDYIIRLHQAGGTAFETMPGDLFFPSTEPQSRRRTISLPNGENGEFEVRWSAQIEQGKGWLRRAERQVITRIDQSERRSSEVWTLEPFDSFGR